MIMKFHLRLLSGGIALFALLATAGARADDAKPLRVGVSADYPPVIYKQGDDIFGFEADNAQGVAEALGRPLKFVEMPFAELIPALREEQIDVIMSGMTATEERSKLVSFSEPYVTVNLGVLVRKADKGKFTSAAALRKAEIVIGAQEGSTGHEYARVYCWGKKSIVFLSVAEVPAALASGKIDVYFRDTPVVQWIQSLNTDELESLDFGLEPQPLAWAVNHTDRGLRNQLNKLVKRWNKSGRLAETTARWLPGHDSSAAASAGMRSALVITIDRASDSSATTAEIAIDGKVVRSTDLVVPRWEVFYMDPGTHTVEIRVGDTVAKRTADIDPGQVVWRRIALDK